MTKQKVVLYIAQSLDGYIARPDGNIDWLMAIPNPDDIDHGYGEFMKQIGCTVMGRKTYEEVLGFGVDWPYPGIPTYICSSRENYTVSTPDTYACNPASLETWTRELLAKTPGDLWLIGGGQLIQQYLNLNLIDEMTISMIPVIIGEGIPLFPPPVAESKWQLISTDAYSTGIVNLRYIKVS